MLVGLLFVIDVFFLIGEVCVEFGIVVLGVDVGDFEEVVWCVGFDYDVVVDDVDVVGVVDGGCVIGCYDEWGVWLLYCGEGGVKL